MFKNPENQNNLRRLVRFLSRKNEPGYIFAYREGSALNMAIFNVLREQVHQLGIVFLNSNIDSPILNQIQEFIEKENSNALIIANLGALIGDKESGHTRLSEINFSREALHQLEIPIVFWISEDTFARLSNGAPDLFSQKRLPTVIFENEDVVNIAEEGPGDYNMSTKSTRGLQDQHTSTDRLLLLREQYTKALETVEDNEQLLVSSYIIPYLLELSKYDLKEEIYAIFEKHKAAFNFDSIDHLGNLGSTFGNIREFDRALWFYTAALDTFKADVVEPEKANLLFARADVFLKLGRIEDALEDFQHALSIYKELTVTFPENHLFQNFKGITYEQIGAIYIEMNQLNEAEDALEKSLKIDLNLNKTFPDNPQLKNGLAISYQRLGELNAKMGKLKTARDYLKKSIDIERSLLLTDPENKIRKHNLAVSLYHIGGLLHKLGDFDMAIQYLVESADVQETLIATYQNETFLKEGITSAYQLIGEILYQTGKKEESFKYLELGLRLSEELVTLEPQNIKFKNSYGTALSNLAQFYMHEKGYRTKARKLAEDAHEVFKELNEKHPQYSVFEQNLEMLEKIIGDIESD